MTSPLPQAHDAAEGDPAEPTRAPIVCTVAGPRMPFSSEIYTGAELRATSLRPGAYDALALPSVFNGRRRARELSESVHTSGRAERSLAAVLKTIEQVGRFNDAASEASNAMLAFVDAIKPARKQGPLRELTPVRVARAGYLPKAGSIPSMLLAHLQEHGGHLTYSEIKQRFGLPQSSVTAVFKKALVSGVLVRRVVGQRAAFALPGYVPPPDAPRPSKELAARKALLDRRRRELAELEREVQIAELKEHITR